MARITLDSIVQELEPKGWEVLSTEQKNLSTEMVFKCPEGHKVFSTWEHLRKKCECPSCMQNALKVNKPISTAKPKNKERTLALDQATHITGQAIFDGDQLVTQGTFETQTDDEALRFHEVNEWFMSMVHMWKPDIVGIEGIQYQQNMGVTTFQTLARLQGILMETCLQLNVKQKLCPTNTWRAYCGVKGKARADKKKSMQLLVKNWFDISVSDDCADAIGIGKYVAENHSQQVEIISWE